MKALVMTEYYDPIPPQTGAMLKMTNRGDFHLKAGISYRAVEGHAYEAMLICLSVVDSLAISKVSSTFRQIVLCDWTSNELESETLSRTGRLSIPDFGTSSERCAKMGYLATLLILMEYGDKLNLWAKTKAVTDLLNSIAKPSDWSEV